jgi:hypothetical protein
MLRLLAKLKSNADEVIQLFLAKCAEGKEWEQLDNRTWVQVYPGTLSPAQLRHSLRYPQNPIKRLIQRTKRGKTNM